jgi:2-alkyl-3-oxoalkanoate reductase
MKVLITGASGFLGQYVVPSLLASGHRVRVVVRPGRDFQSFSWSQHHEQLEVVEADLAACPFDYSILLDVDAVIHLAASKASDFEVAYRDTVVATQNLLEAMEKSQIWRLIALSSFSVYDYSDIKKGNCLDETLPLDTNPELRDAYAHTKLLQEQAICAFAVLPEAAVTILRPGMIYGKDSVWNACQGTGAGPTWLLIGPAAQMPLTYVENCAEAIVATLETGQAVGEVLNIVDDDLPTRKAYTAALIQLGDWSPTVIPIPWVIFRSVATLVWSGNQILLGGKLKLPGLLSPARLDARLKPLTYTNAKAKRVLGWQPRYSWQVSLERCFTSTSQ